MRIILILILVSLTAGCSGLVDTIRKNQQKQQIYKQYASKYYASCQKEAFSYYPVAIVKKEKPKNIYKPQTEVTCTTYGNITNCRDSTADYSGLIEQANITANLLDGNADTYDANAGSRNNHIKNCIDNNLRSDSSYSDAISRINYNSGAEKSRTANKSTLNKKKSIYFLHSFEKTGTIYTCFYGDKKQYSIGTVSLPCNPEGFF